MTGSCCGSYCIATAQHFDETIAEKDLERYRQDGPDLTTRLLLDSLRDSALPESTLLDVGSGIGVLSFELLAAGMGSATLVDASPAYLRVAGAEAQRRNVEPRLSLVPGDFVAVVDRVGVVDVVVLDRAVCCYPDYEVLLEKALARCRGVLGLSYPRDRWSVRAMTRAENLARRLKRDDFRVFVHPEAALEAIVEKAGFRRLSRRSSWVWRADVYARTRV